VLAALRSSIPACGRGECACEVQRTVCALITGQCARTGWRTCAWNMQQTQAHDSASAPAIICSEQPQARFDSFGAAALSDTELLALMLQSGLDRNRLLGVASRLMAEAGSLHGIMAWTSMDFQRLQGIGAGKARQLAALVEIARRMMKPAGGERPLFNRSDLIAQHMQPTTHGLEVEKFWVACLNRKNRLKRLVEVTSGTATAALAHPREVFRAAIQYGATAVVCIHNHPSGDPAPSAADLQITRQLRDAARAVDIDLLDHVIMGLAGADPTGRGYYSFREAGLV
jgi:DNA repair protein RadC